MGSLNRYHVDPEFRAKQIRNTINYQKKRAKRDPLYRHIRRFRGAVYKKVTGLSPIGFIPLREYQEHLAASRAIHENKNGLSQEEKCRIMVARWKSIKANYKVLPPPPPPPKPRRISKKNLLSEDQKRRNQQILEANLARGVLKKQAKQEWIDLTTAWKTKWWPILGRNGSQKNRQRRRNNLISATRIKGDHALAKQELLIRSGPCICFWCEKHLPRGGTVDHIIALANGGTHTSGNICASCSPCNSLKGQHSPQAVGFTPSLL